MGVYIVRNIATSTVVGSVVPDATDTDDACLQASEAIKERLTLEAGAHGDDPETVIAAREGLWSLDNLEATEVTDPVPL